MEFDNFDEKFKKLIDILTTDESKAAEFSAIDTVDDSFDYACKLVGNMDRSKYHLAVKKYISNLDSDDKDLWISSPNHSFFSTDHNVDESEKKKISGGTNVYKYSHKHLNVKF